MADALLVEILGAYTAHGMADGMSARVDELFKTLTGEDVLTAYSVLPRELSQKQLFKVLAEEKKLGSDSVSKSLVASKFAGLKLGSEDMCKVYAHVLQVLPAHDDACFLLRQQLVSACPDSLKKELDIESHALQLLAAALNDPNQWLMEGIVDLPPYRGAIQNAELKSLTEFTKTLLVSDKGTMTAYETAIKGPVSGVLAKFNINCRAKVQVLALLRALKASDGKLSYDAAQKAVQAANHGEVEDLVVRGIQGKVFTARLTNTDTTKEISAEGFAVLDFNADEWKTLQSQLHQWQALTDSVIGELTNPAPYRR
jgi:hypothetical protein